MGRKNLEGTFFHEIGRARNGGRREGQKKRVGEKIGRSETDYLKGRVKKFQKAEGPGQFREGN